MPKLSADVQTRYRVDYDPDAQFEECNGEARPLTEAEYATDGYRGCLQHPRTKIPPARVENGRAWCGECGAEYADLPYAEYLAYFGNPERHVYLYVQREDRCPCCDAWVKGGSVWGIDVMDDAAADFAGAVYTLDQLPGYLREVANDLDPDETLRSHTRS